MSKDIYSLSEICEEIAHLPQRLEQTQEVVAVTRHGEPVMAILSWKLYESLIETMEVLSDEDLMASFRQGVQELVAGEGKPWEEVKSRLSV